MKFQLKNACVPPGAYAATFVGIQETNHEKWGPGLCFEFEILGGEYAGKSAFRTTGTDPTPGNKLGKLLASLAGVKPADGLNVDPDDFVGQPYDIIVIATENSTKVENVIRKTPPSIATGKVTAVAPLPVLNGMDLPSTDDIPFAPNVC